MTLRRNGYYSTFWLFTSSEPLKPYSLPMHACAKFAINISICGRYAPNTKNFLMAVHFYSRFWNWSPSTVHTEFRQNRTRWVIVILTFPTQREVDSFVMLRTAAFFIRAVFTICLSVTPPCLQSALSVSASEHVAWTRFNRGYCFFIYRIHITLLDSSNVT